MTMLDKPIDENDVVFIVRYGGLNDTPVPVEYSEKLAKQWGETSHKIRGFFDFCRAKGVKLVWITPGFRVEPSIIKEEPRDLESIAEYDESSKNEIIIRDMHSHPQGVRRFEFEKELSKIKTPERIFVLVENVPINIRLLMSKCRRGYRDILSHMDFPVAKTFQFLNEKTVVSC